MPEGSAQCVVTSPPYWGLRDYGIPPSVWGGDDGHAHSFGPESRILRTGGTGASTLGGEYHRNGLTPESIAAKVARSSVDASQGSFCECGAWFGVLGLEPTPELYLVHMVTVFAEVWRVLANDGVLWINIGDSYAGARRGGSGDCDSSTLQGRRNTVSRRRDNAEIPRSDLAIAGCKPKDMVGVPWMLAFALRSSGWYLRSEIIWQKPNAMPESSKDRPTKAHETIFLLSKSERYFYDWKAISEECSPNTHARMQRANSGTSAPGQTAHAGVAGPRPNRKPGVTPKAEIAQPGTRNNVSFGAAVAGLVERRNKRTVWTMATSPFKEAHFATFPAELPRTCILAGSRPGDLILDPFNGAGTTGVVAIQNGRHYVGLEINPDYCEMSRRRLRKAGGQEEPWET